MCREQRPVETDVDKISFKDLTKERISLNSPENFRKMCFCRLFLRATFPWNSFRVLEQHRSDIL